MDIVKSTQKWNGRSTHNAKDSVSTLSSLTEVKNKQPVKNDISSRSSFTKADLEECAAGNLFGAGNAQLPTSPLLMIDRILDIKSTGGDFNRGYAIAELDIEPDKWFFKSHFQGDPVVPGCLLIESLWQLTGFHLAWSGYTGKGRVLESGKTRFIEAIDDTRQTLRISMHVRRVLTANNPVYIASGNVTGNSRVKCRSESIIVGLY